MSIQHTILGLLHRKAMTGYDLKKIIQDSPFMPWSGNNNQIYKSLVALLDSGFVTHEVQHQESSPSKKIYSITDSGEAELKRWLMTTPEPPEFKNLFLIQFACAEPLHVDELLLMLGNYEDELDARIRLVEELQRRDPLVQGRSARESRIWELVYEHSADVYRHEKAWLQKLRRELIQLNDEE